MRSVYKKIIVLGGIAAAIALLTYFYTSTALDGRQAAEDILQKADIRINGDRPWDIQVHNEKLYDRVFQQGSLGLGEAYMDGWWDCAALDQFFDRIFRAQLEKYVQSNWTLLLHGLKAKCLNLQTKRGIEGCW